MTQAKISKPSEALLPTTPPAKSTAPSSSARSFPRSFLTPTGEVELSAQAIAALERLASHPPVKDQWSGSELPRGVGGRAAVLIAIFPSRDGARLNVLLSRRSWALRTYPGQIALPGGRTEPDDARDLETTARREAFEETGLPIDPDRVRYLTTLEPILSRAGVLITPIVAYVTDYSLRPELNADEVESLFSFPLEAFLSTSYNQPQPASIADRPARPEDLPPNTTAANSPPAPRVAFYQQEDYAWFEGRPHRFHKFNLPRPEGVKEERSVEGLTAGILVACARIAYGRAPEFEERARGQMSIEELVEAAGRSEPIPLRDSQKLGQGPDGVKSKL